MQTDHQYSRLGKRKLDYDCLYGKVNQFHKYLGMDQCIDYWYMLDPMDIHLILGIPVGKLVVFQYNLVDMSKLLGQHYLYNYYSVHMDLASMDNHFVEVVALLEFHDIGKMDHQLNLMGMYMLEYVLKHGKWLSFHKFQYMDPHIYF